MHRHGYKGRKLGRESNQRKALIKSLSVALVDTGSIETTLPKAKELVPFVEKLITKAKVGTLHSRRQVISVLGDLTTVEILYDEILPATKSRTSGYLRIEKTSLRRGDSAPMARVSFVDDLLADTKKKSAPAEKTETKPVNKEPVGAENVN